MNSEKVATHGISEQGMGTRPTQEVPTDFLILPRKIRICDTHSFRAHHLLQERRIRHAEVSTTMNKSMSVVKLRLTERKTHLEQPTLHFRESAHVCMAITWSKW